MSINYADPMVGFYDRMVAEGDQEKIVTAAGIIYMLQGTDPKQLERYRQYCIENGYGSQETMRRVLPNFEQAV